MSSSIHASMFSPVVRCHYLANIGYNMVPNNAIVLNNCGERKVNGADSVEIVWYTVQNGNIHLVPGNLMNSVDLHA